MDTLALLHRERGSSTHGTKPHRAAATSVTPSIEAAMTLEYVIYRLTRMVDAPSPYNSNEDIEAFKVAIEACKRLQRLRSDKHCDPLKPLPGEERG